MRTSNFLLVCKCLAALCLLIAFGLCVEAYAQTPNRTQTAAPAQTPASPVSAARESELECSGFIEHRPPETRMEIVGGEEEQEQHTYAEGDYVYVNAGSQDGVRAGQEFTIIRPRGRFKSSFSRKGTLGMYTQELGRLRVVSVKQNLSVALLTRTCDNILLGDLLRPVPRRVSPVVGGSASFDRFAEPSGKPQGRIVLARDGREMVSRDQVVFIDLGEEDNVKPGDRLTVFRPLGTGDISRFKDEEISLNRSRGFESDVFRGGGRYSNKAQRVKNPVKGNNSTVTTPNVKDRRPALPRKVVGELVVISVEARTAAAVVTRTAQEIHTGDRVEVQ